MSTAARKARRKRNRIRLAWEEIALKTLLLPAQPDAGAYLRALDLRCSPGNCKQLLAAWSRLKVDPRDHSDYPTFKRSLWQTYIKE